MNKWKNVLWFAVLYVITVACSRNNMPADSPKKDNFRVLGYLASDNSWNTDLAGIDLSKITDLNLAFLNPDSNGVIAVNDELRKVVQSAHAKNVRIYFSIGGGDGPAYLANLMKDNARGAFISSLVDIAVNYQFDGVDVDLENSLVNGNYAAFVSDLAAALKPKGKLITAAVASWNAGLIDDQTFAKYDFINIMSYDKTGPWAPTSPGPHSPFTMAQEDFTYFNKTRNIPAAKLLVGLPFYGYQFGATVTSWNYKDIIQQFPGAENSDSVDVAGGRIYYNGMPTIRQKVSFAVTNHAAGVMIWELHQDSNDAKSLLKVINDIKK